MPRKCFLFVSTDHLIVEFQKQHKENKKQQKQLRFIERGILASQKECRNNENKNDQTIHASTERMSDNE